MTVKYDAELKELISSIMKDFHGDGEEKIEEGLLLRRILVKLISREAHEGYFLEKLLLFSSKNCDVDWHQSYYQKGA